MSKPPPPRALRASHADNLLPFSFPSVARKKVTADFDGGRLTSDGGVMLLSMAEHRLGVAERLARCFPDHRDPARITHTLADMIRARIFAISCGYEDADDLDFLRRSGFSARRSSLQAGLRAATRYGPRSLFATNPVTAGECAFAEGHDPAELCARRPMDGLV